MPCLMTCFYLSVSISAFLSKPKHTSQACALLRIRKREKNRVRNTHARGASTRSGNASHLSCEGILGSNPSASAHTTTHSFLPIKTHTHTRGHACVPFHRRGRSIAAFVCACGGGLGGVKERRGRRRGLHAVVDMRGAMDECERSE